jgi:hypothetical protein
VVALAHGNVHTYADHNLDCHGQQHAYAVSYGVANAHTYARALGHRVADELKDAHEYVDAYAGADDPQSYAGADYPESHAHVDDPAVSGTDDACADAA